MKTSTVLFFLVGGGLAIAAFGGDSDSSFTNAQLCAHMRELLLLELSPDEVDGILSDCEQRMAHGRATMGAEAFDRLARCIMDASTVEELAPCLSLIPRGA